MKKLLCLLVLSAFVVGGSLFAQKGGFVDPAKSGFRQSPARKISTVAEAKALPDDAIVSLRGFIVEQLGDEKYRFKDEVSEETIVIEVDDDKWKGLTVTPDDLILIFGEVDKGLLSATEIDVEWVRKAPPARRGDKPATAPGCTNCGCATSQKK